jgi:HAD superfamily hydrolase (TIGR01509 family)
MICVGRSTVRSYTAPMPRLDRDVSAVIFDLDGTLIESEQVWSVVKRDLSLERGGRWSEAAETDMLGMSSPEWTRYMRDELGLAMELSAISDAVAQMLADRYRAELPLIPGADEAVRALADRFPMGLASSSNRGTIDLVIELAGWTDLFSVTTSSEEVPAGKPAPDVYLETAGRLGIPVASSVAIEDAGVGILSAHAAGLAVVAIPNRAYPPDAEALSRAEVVLESIWQLPAALP